MYEINGREKIRHSEVNIYTKIKDEKFIKFTLEEGDVSR